MASIGTLSIHCNLETRKALYKPSKLNAVKYGLSTSEPTPVGVFGLFQVKDEDEIDAYFVVELPDGKCCYAGVTQIQFTEEKEEEPG